MQTAETHSHFLSRWFAYLRSPLRFLVLLLFGLTTVAIDAAQQPQQPQAVKTQSSGVATKGTATKRIGGSSNSHDCPFCDLRGMDFENKDLSNGNLSGADLTGANLTNAKLNGAVLLRANLTDAVLTDASLDSSPGHPTNLTGANLTRANLAGSHLNGVIFEHANITCADLSNTDTRRAHFGPTLKIDQGAACQTKFRNAVLSCEFNHDWKKLDTTRAKLPRCKAAPPSSYYCGAAVVSSFTNVIYVSATLGTDSDTCGTSLTQQCQTIQKGISRCSGANCNVLVDYNNYSPAATITLADGVNVYGGCATQTQPDPTYFSLIYAPNGGVAGVNAVSTQTATLFQGFTIMGSNAVTGAANLSSVGFLSQNNAALTLAYVTISAGAGANGGVGANGATGTVGGNASGQTAGTNTCSTGANGGTGAQTSQVWMTDGHCCDFLNVSYCATCNFNNYSGSSGYPGGTGNWAAGGGTGSNVCYGCPHSDRPGSAGNGTGGNAGGCGSGGTPSSNTVGSIQNGAWIPSVGGTGPNGSDGGGGGGGGSGGSCGYISCFSNLSAYAGTAGGGGGAGGCTGTGGNGGQQGGASIALTINGGTVALNKASIIGGTGGNGGQGGNGLGGGTGGTGSSVPASDPCNNTGGGGGTGGNGGTGGAGSGGAGGNGGPAFGLITFSGGSFTQTATNFSLGSSGLSGTFGTGGNQSTGGTCAGNNGTQGVAGTVANQQSF